MEFISTETNPAPPNAELAMIETPDGARLRAGFFQADKPRATIALVTGWFEIIEKYFETVEDLRARGLNVAMIDWRGQGGSCDASTRAIGWRNYFSLLRNDLQFFTEAHIKSRFSGPMALMSHSMGGMPALMLLAAGYEEYERAVLCAPMTRLFREPTNSFIGAAVDIGFKLGLAQRKTRSSGKPARFEESIHTSDEARFHRTQNLMKLAPPISTAGPRLGWLRAAMKASRRIHQPGYFDRLKTPIRIISAGREQQIDGSDHRNIASAHALIDQIVIEPALHEIMMERDEIRADYWRVVDDFLKPLCASDK